MNKFGERLKAAREAMGITSQAAAGRLVGLGGGAFGKIERGETARPNNWEKIAEAFGIPVDEADDLINQDAVASGKESKLSAPVAATRVTPRWKVRRTQPGTVPILGYAAAGDPDRFVMLNDVMGEAQVASTLAGTEGAYALYVYGPSMIPRYFPGELVFVHPRKPLTADCFCVVQIGDDPESPEGGYIKQFKSWNGDKLIVYQFNPKETIEFDASRVIDVHRIVGSGDD